MCVSSITYKINLINNFGQPKHGARIQKRNLYQKSRASAVMQLAFLQESQKTGTRSS